MKASRVLSLILSLIFLCSCSASLQEYYYSLENFKTSKYYKYENITDPSQTQYWKISANVEQNELVTEAFNSEKIQFEYFKEKFDDSGSKLIEYSPINSGIKTKTVAIHRDVFLWTQKESYQYEVEYSDSNGSTTFTKERKFKGLETITCMGMELEVAKFRGDYTFFNHKYNEEITFWQESFYAKKYGFVKYERHLPNGSVSILELTEILTEEEWSDLR